jgi:hypothetical protein
VLRPWEWLADWQELGERVARGREQQVPGVHGGFLGAFNSSVAVKEVGSSPPLQDVVCKMNG